MTPGPFTGVTVAAIAAQLRSGELDPVTLTEQSLAAIEASQPILNAFVTVDAQGARRAAAIAQAELSRGDDRGPLHGIPVAVKDIVDTAGLRTTMGSAHFADHVPERDAVVVTRLREAGAVIVGKTTTHQFAFGPTGDRTANGPCANPHDPTRMAGGSSAGSAAAVAAGLVALAVGTDTGGSVRIPAALCGVTGLRPSPGLIPLEGVFPLSWSLDSVGPIASDVSTAALGFQIFAGTSTRPAAADLSAVRFGQVVGAWFDRLDDTVRTGLSTVLSRLPCVPVSLPDAAELREIYALVQMVEALSIHEERLANAPNLFDPEVRQRLELAPDVSAVSYAVALRTLNEVRASAADRFGDRDVLLLPTVPVVAPPLHARDTPLGGGWSSPRDALLSHTAPLSVLGLPAISLPIPSTGSLPIGLQLVGRPGADAALLAVAVAVEERLRTV